ncbi:MAG: type II toxin-antitoxin system RelE/ParE family toxin [Bacillota bacterium]|nr:type II toxin-antitoxin system RelE/ParE family toxin [Bacillota bacterium]
MVEYDVRVYPAAERDLEDIVDYLNALSPQAAIKCYDLIIEKLEGLARMPQRCPLVRVLALKAKGYRCLVVEDYLVFLVIRAGTVQIRRIMHGKRNYESLL